MFKNQFWRLLKIVIWLLIAPAQIDSYSNRDSWELKQPSSCPMMYAKRFVGYAPKGNISAGNFTEMKKYNTLKLCTMACCRKPTCNIVFMHDSTCYHVQCVNDELCIPIPRPEKQMSSHVSLVLVRPVQDGASWGDILEEHADVNSNFMGHYIGNEEVLGSNHYDTIDDRYFNDDILTDESNDWITRSRECELGIGTQCHEHEECIEIAQKFRSGMCQCITGYTRNSTGLCQPENIVSSVAKQNSTLKVQKKQLTVSAVSKEVRLPESETTISVFAIPNPVAGQHYTYEWTLVKRPANSEAGTMSDQDGATLHLTHLTEGLYTFKVSVSSADAYGETLANVSVLPPKRINRPPVVIITPASQIVRLPNTGAVLDGSSSHDDDSITTWHWDLQRGPLGYSPHLPETPTLQLNDLSVPGNYTFRLTVTDSDQTSNSTSANITVLKVIDYPPVANAGQDVIIYLPHNELTLNGNLSTDDHEITSWEWTKSPGDNEKAADMQDTRTPYLRLSHLEKGIYTFSLRVTDSAGQSSTAEVHVFVKPASHKPPVAHAGNNLTISLPQTWATLDGSGTSESGHLTSYRWEQIEGPAGASFSSINSSRTNITKLTRGHYVLRFTVTDDSGNIANDIVVLNVTQIKNERPKANAGGDQTIGLPQSVIKLNGSLSHDDLAIATWQWTREDISLAIGDILGGSDHEPVLILGNLEPGRYVFKLRVTDEEGLSDEDTASLMVNPDPMILHVVELTLGAQARTLTQSQVHGVMQELGLLVRDEASLKVHEIHTEHPGGRAILSLIAHSGTKVLSAPQLERLLREKLRRDSGLLRLSVASLRTAVCQNNCSNHGVCDERTRKCLCEAFWMQNLFEKHLGNGEADCQWSVLYVIVALCSVGLGIGGLVWGTTFLCARVCHQRRIRSSTQRPPRYALLGDDEQPTFSGPKLPISESDTDSDVLFESRNKTGQRELIRNGHAKTSRNGFIKLGRRVKT